MEQGHRGRKATKPAIFEGQEEDSPESRTQVVVGWLAGCATSRRYAGVSQGRICPDDWKCCRTEIEVADETFHLIQSQFSDTGPTCPICLPFPPPILSCMQHVLLQLF